MRVNTEGELRPTDQSTYDRFGVRFRKLYFYQMLVSDSCDISGRSYLAHSQPLFQTIKSVPLKKVCHFLFVNT